VSPVLYACSQSLSCVLAKCTQTKQPPMDVDYPANLQTFKVDLGTRFDQCLPKCKHSWQWHSCLAASYPIWILRGRHFPFIHNVKRAAGYFECNNNVVVGRPSSLLELQAQVQGYDHVKAVGVGHSWWQQQFCSGADSSSINIVLTQMNSTLTE